MKGQLQLSSERGKGSIFSVELDFDLAPTPCVIHADAVQV